MAELRKDRGIKLGDLALMLGITPAEARLVEEGKVKPRLCVAQKWANALGVGFDEFCISFYESTASAREREESGQD